jgi:nucleoside-diphosphate-sugar epimerase
MKRILVIGSTSMVGRGAGELLATEDKVFYAGRKSADFPFDLENVDLLPFQNQRFDVVIFAAANFGGVTDVDLTRAEKVNSLGALETARLARLVQAEHLIIISSVSALYAAGNPYHGIYSISKRHGEELVLLYCEGHGIPLTILRPTALYDSRSRSKTHQSLFYLIIDKARKGEDITFFGTNDALRNYLYIDDLSGIITRVARKRCVGIFHCLSQKYVRLSEIAEIAYEAFGQKGTIRFSPDKPQIFDCEIIRDNTLYERINFSPQVGLSEGIGRIREVRASHD